VIFGFADSKAYRQINTTFFPGGEMRSCGMGGPVLEGTPGPATMFLAAGALFSLIGFRRPLSRA
jgi:hypothetical protein